MGSLRSSTRDASGGDSLPRWHARGAWVSISDGDLTKTDVSSLRPVSKLISP